ncbi:MAG: hypothetical protein ACFFBD_22660, partial [Candidatus Hodarchaeota archaeon]
MFFLFKIELVDESNTQIVLDFLKQDIAYHAFAFYDLNYKPEHTIMYVAFENGILKGYMLIYTALEFPS